MLKQARLKRGLRQKDISMYTGLSQGYVSKLENNCFKHSPTITQIVKLSILLDVDVLNLAEYFIEKELSFYNDNLLSDGIEKNIKDLLMIKSLRNKKIISNHEYFNKKKEILKYL